MSFSDLVGKKILNIESSSDEIIFHTDNGSFKMYHEQDCCETVSIEDIDGDLTDLIGEFVLAAEESSNSGTHDDEYHDSFTWTFYKIRTLKTSLTIRWYGSSNGYYSEGVSFYKID
jgi:hypothetical protein